MVSFMGEIPETSGIMVFLRDEKSSIGVVPEVLPTPNRTQVIPVVVDFRT